MKRHTWTALARPGLVIAAVMAATATAGAQQPHLIRIGLGGGMSIPANETGNALRTGPHGEGFVLVHLPGLPALRFDLGYQHLDYRSAFTGAPNATNQILSGVAGLHIDLLHAGPVRPYIMAGVGAFNFRSSVDSTGAARSTSTTRFGIDGGAGIAFSLGRVDAFVEGKVQNIYTNQGVIDRKSIQVIPVTFGIMF